MTIKTIQFNHCKVYIDLDHERIETVFEDGTSYVVLPEYNKENIAKAHNLGYKGNVWDMVVAHQLTHTILAEMEGLPVCPLLWAAAHNDLQNPSIKAVSKLQEERIYEFQRFAQVLISKYLEIMDEEVIVSLFKPVL